MTTDTSIGQLAKQNILAIDRRYSLAITRQEILDIMQHKILASIQKEGARMATPNEKLADSLKVLKSLQHAGWHVFESKQFSRVHRSDSYETAS